MPRAGLDQNFSKIDDLIKEINALVPSNAYREIQFRADLAGLLVVAMAATYETCVKEVLYEHANGRNVAFGEYTSRNYQKLNSRVRVNDLKKYCELFSPDIGALFKAKLTKKRKSIILRSGRNIETSYEQILDWRHDFAHAGIRNTTIEEAALTHMFAKRVIYVFDEAFGGT